MKEFRASTGGRFTYNDDILNLQDLALAFGELFDGCGNFVISGCQPSGNSISEGFVYLNGKVRKFNGKSNIETWPQYLYEVEYTEDLPYASGTSKVARKVYTCQMEDQVPQSAETPPQYIQFNHTPALTLKDAFFGKYSLILNPANAGAGQVVNSKITFNPVVYFEGGARMDRPLWFNSGNKNAKIYWDSDSFSIEAIVQKGLAYKMTFNNQGEITLTQNDTLIATFTTSQTTFPSGLRSNNSTIGKVCINNDSIFCTTTPSNGETLKINCAGYNGGNAYFRNTAIGNGKGQILFQVNGSDNHVHSYVPLKAATRDTTTACLTLMSSTLGSASEQASFISFEDSSSHQFAKLGIFGDSTLFQLVTHNKVRIDTQGQGVDIYPAIYEAGVSLSSKYVKKADYNVAMNNKADASNVYTKNEADVRFAWTTGGLGQFISESRSAEAICNEIEAAYKRNGLSQFIIGANSPAVLRSQIYAAFTGGGFTQFIDNTNTASVLRSQIGAASTTGGLLQFIQGHTSEATLRYQIKAASTEHGLTQFLNNYTKEQLRQQIEAISADEVPTITNTGWIKINDNLSVCQYGRVVSIVGTIPFNRTLNHVLFVLPSSISRPISDIRFKTSGTNLDWYVGFDKNSPNCTTRSIGTNTNGTTIGTQMMFNMIYMV